MDLAVNRLVLMINMQPLGNVEVLAVKILQIVVFAKLVNVKNALRDKEYKEIVLEHVGIWDIYSVTVLILEVLAVVNVALASDLYIINLIY